jgi:hypothetical protein
MAKTTTEGETGTCQVCERTCKIVRGGISLHGYNRPGCGFIQGRCFGAAALPWSQSCVALQEYIVILQARRAQCEKSIAYYADPSLAEVTEYEKAHVYAKPEPKVYKRGERYDTRYQLSVDVFACIVSGRISKAESDIKALDREIERQSKRVAGWSPAAA